MVGEPVQLWWVGWLCSLEEFGQGAERGRPAGHALHWTQPELWRGPRARWKRRDGMGMDTAFGRWFGGVRTGGRWAYSAR